MKKIILIFLLPLFFGCSSEENNDDSIEIFCSAKLIDNPISCMFYFFEAGEYKSIEVDTKGTPNSFGQAKAIKIDGTSVDAIGYAYYSGDKLAVAKYHDWYNKGYKQRNIIEGTFYVACFPSNIGYRFPYKAKIFSKKYNEGLFINPIFTSESYYGVNGYKYFEWDK